ncbi:uncharacterized protein [Neodiprion pinetum]|uniref:uncharacterized protein n=1 Tax=Neodiprion pinetum TaxID=441929 RepID=UPI001EDDC671|nr:uncharacterized protein LOC124221476 [Neodiprion pinetum]XP_046630252.1 uncharacterized protein LOC124310402 [Neodiprion virginianus]
MAGIFDLFGKTDDPIQRAPIMPEHGRASKQRNHLEGPVATPVKLFGTNNGCKPKGLSMRSYSDLNINTASSKPSMSLKNKKQTETLKPSVTQMDLDGKPVSPRSKSQQFLKVKDLKPLSTKTSSPKSKFLEVNSVVKLHKNDVFKKPLTPTVIKNTRSSSQPEPEKLAFYYDEEENYMNTDDQPTAPDFEELVANFTRSIQTYDDEGFESDPEMLPFPVLPELKLRACLKSEQELDEDSLSLPDISDNDEF